MEYDLDTLTTFVNEQIEFHNRMFEHAKETNDERRTLRHQQVADRYKQLIAALGDCRSRSQSAVKRLALTWEDVADLPEELRSELSVSDGDKLEFDIIQILEDNGGVASLDRLLVELYKKTNEIYQRTWLNNRLYRMAQKDMLFSVPSRKGVYSLEVMSKEDALILR